MMKKSLKSIVVLVSICAAVSLLLSLTNYITAPIIEKNELKRAQAAMFELMPDAGSFTEKSLDGYNLPKSVNSVYEAENGGFIVKLTTTGYSSGMVVMCAISEDGKIVGSKLVSSSETPSIGGAAAPLFAQTANGKDINNIDSVDTIADATKTTEAYRNALKDALGTVIILGGGEVDLRTEEEKLQDNLHAALPEANKAFEKYFFVEEIEGVSAIYFAENDTGAVCIVGEVFVAVDASGNVLTECTQEEAQYAENAVSIAKSTTTTSIDLTLFSGISAQVISAKRTATGNYILEVQGIGYGILGGNKWHPASGEYIIVKVSLTASGRIIDCYTVSQG